MLLAIAIVPERMFHHLWHICKCTLDSDCTSQLWVCMYIYIYRDTYIHIEINLCMFRCQHLLQAFLHHSARRLNLWHLDLVWGNVVPGHTSDLTRCMHGDQIESCARQTPMLTAPFAKKEPKPPNIFCGSSCCCD